MSSTAKIRSIDNSLHGSLAETNMEENENVVPGT